jgi:hypothetical protein
MMQVRKPEDQIITHYDVFDQRPSDRDLLSGVIEPMSACWGECRS